MDPKFVHCLDNGLIADDFCFRPIQPYFGKMLNALGVLRLSTKVFLSRYFKISFSKGYEFTFTSQLLIHTFQLKCYDKNGVESNDISLCNLCLTQLVKS